MRGQGPLQRDIGRTICSAIAINSDCEVTISRPQQRREEINPSPSAKAITVAIETIDNRFCSAANHNLVPSRTGWAQIKPHSHLAQKKGRS